MFTSILSGLVQTGLEDGLVLSVQPAAGSAVVVEAFRVYHRLEGATEWASLTVPAATSTVSVEGYLNGQTVQLRVRSIASGLEGGATALVTVTIGAEEPALPDQLPLSAVGLVAQADQVTISVLVPATQVPGTLILYRTSAGSNLDKASDSITPALPATAGQTITHVDAGLSAGDWDYWVGPFNADNIAGPVTGPVTVTLT